MLTALAVALPLAHGAPVAAVAAVALALERPVWAAGALAVGAAARFARRPPDRAVDLEARFLLALAAELRTGATWRQALVAAAARVPGLALGPAVARAQAGRDAAHVAVALHLALRHLGRPAAAALGLGATAGAPAADVFGTLAGQAAQRAGDRRERAAATAQARLSAALVGGAPVVLALLLLAGGRAQAAAMAGPAGPVLLAVGAGLLVTGGAVVVLMLRAAES